MKNNPLIIFSLSALILLGVNPIKAEDITPEIKTASQLRQIQSAQLLSQQTSPPVDDEIDITVTGTRTPRELLDTPGSITIIRREDIQLNLITNPRDLLRNEPNIDTIVDPRFGFRGINIRGIEGNRVLLQVDGIRLPREFNILGRTLYTGRDFVDVGTLNRVEILRSAGSALYGSDALGGTVSFQTLDPKDLLDLVGKNDYYEFTIGYDSRARRFSGIGTVAFRTPDKITEGLFTYTRRDFTELQRKDAEDRFVDRQTGNNNSYLAKLNFRLDEFSRLQLTGEVFNRSTETILAPANLVDGAFSALTTSFTSGLRTNRTRLSVEYQFNNPNSTSFIQLARLLVYYQKTETPETSVEFRRAVAGGPTILVREGFNQFFDKIGGVDLQLTSIFQTGDIRHRLTYGGELSFQRNERPRDRIQTNLVTGVRTRFAIPDIYPTKDFPDSDTSRFGLFLQDEIEIGNVSVIPGIRIDFYNLTAIPDADYFRNGALPPANFTSTAVSPRLGIVWKTTPEVSLFAQYARGFRAPAYDEINANFANLIGFPPATYQVLPNPNLQAETSDNFEIGIRGNFPQGKFSLVGFYNFYNNFILPNAEVARTGGVPNIIFQSINRPRVEIYGIEASGELRFSPERFGLSILGSLGFVVGDDKGLNQPLPTINPFKAVAGLRYRAPEDQWGVDLTATYVGKPRVPDRLPTGTIGTGDIANVVVIPNDYVLVDLTGFVKFSPQLTLNLGVFNLFDTLYFDYSDLRFSGLNRNNPADVARVGRFGQPGRSFAASLNWRF